MLALVHVEIDALGPALVGTGHVEPPDLVLFVNELRVGILDAYSLSGILDVELLFVHQIYQCHPEVRRDCYIRCAIFLVGGLGFASGTSMARFA